MKKLFDFNRLLKDVQFDTKIYIYFAYQVKSDDYDEYQNNTTPENLNPLVIHGYVRAISPEALVWKQYGLHQNGAVEVLTESKYRSYFENANKIVIDSIEYQVFNQGTGNRGLIQARPFQLIRVVLSRAG